jgi:hypothetical protein
MAELATVRVTHTVESHGCCIPKDTSGTVVALHDHGVAYAVGIADLPSGPEVVTLRADQIARAHQGGATTFGPKSDREYCVTLARSGGSPDGKTANHAQQGGAAPFGQVTTEPGGTTTVVCCGAGVEL